MKFRLGQIAVMLMALTAPWATYTTVAGIEVQFCLTAMILMAVLVFRT